MWTLSHPPVWGVDAGWKQRCQQERLAVFVLGSAGQSAVLVLPAAEGRSFHTCCFGAGPRHPSKMWDALTVGWLKPPHGFADLLNQPGLEKCVNMTANWFSFVFIRCGSVLGKHQSCSLFPAGEVHQYWNYWQTGQLHPVYCLQTAGKTNSEAFLPE